MSSLLRIGPRSGSIGLALAIAIALLLVGGCATRPNVPLPGRDGPEANPPPDLMQVPDAVPRIEPIRAGGPNKPYEVLGQSYEPLRPDARYTEDGIASWYGRKFHGRRTASGEVYNMYAMTAAHKTLPLPSYARVTNPANGRSIIVRINDRGPFVRGRIIDLSYTAALKLDLLRGIGRVQVERLTPEAIASGAWRGGAAPVIGGNDDGPPEPVAQAAVPAAPLAPPPGQSSDAAASQPTAAATRAGRGFWVQLGAYRERDGALLLQQQAAERVDGLGLLLAVFSDTALHRVQAGPFETREDAQRVAERVREQLLLAPLVIERR